VNWTYTKRSDGKISVTLDSNVWNFFFDEAMNVAAELPSCDFAIFIPREVEIEMMPIRDKASEALLWRYMTETIVSCNIQTTSVFGFSASEPQRMGSFGFGTFQSPVEREFYAAIGSRFLVGKKAKGSRLTGNEADAAVAAASFFSIVLTCEKPKKVGPLRFASEHGGKVLYLPDFKNSSLSLKEYITAFHVRP
jgi:hypothetical protein